MPTTLLHVPEMFVMTDLPKRAVEMSEETRKKETEASLAKGPDRHVLMRGCWTGDQSYIVLHQAALCTMSMSGMLCPHYKELNCKHEFQSNIVEHI